MERKCYSAWHHCAPSHPLTHLLPTSQPSHTCHHPPLPYTSAYKFTSQFFHLDKTSFPNAQTQNEMSLKKNCRKYAPARFYFSSFTVTLKKIKVPMGNDPKVRRTSRRDRCLMERALCGGPRALSSNDDVDAFSRYHLGHGHWNFGFPYLSNKSNEFSISLIYLTGSL